MAYATRLRDFISCAKDSPFAALLDSVPWEITSKADEIIRKAVGELAGYRVQDSVAVHRTATVEASAIVKAPAIIGPSCFVASGVYLRGGVFLDED